MNYKELEDKVYNYPTKYPEGFLYEEIIELIKEFPTITIKDYGDKLGVHTALLTDDGTVSYHNDVVLGIKLSLENREMNSFEFD